MCKISIREHAISGSFLFYTHALINYTTQTTLASLSLFIAMVIKFYLSLEKNHVNEYKIYWIGALVGFDYHDNYIDNEASVVWELYEKEYYFGYKTEKFLFNLFRLLSENIHIICLIYKKAILSNSLYVFFSWTFTYFFMIQYFDLACPGLRQV